MSNPDPLATNRMQIIIKVQSGQITAQEAADQLNISRTTYYKWEEKALLAMYNAVTNGQAGRPQQSLDPEKAMMAEQIEHLRRQVLFLEEDREIRKILFGDINPGAEEEDLLSKKKKDSRRKKGRKGTAKGKRRR